MKKQYQIYAIGNALVDIEVVVPAAKLTEYAIEKGVMSLIDEARQEKLLQLLQDNRHLRACGGSAANTIIGAQSLGSQCFYSCKVADDENGRFYRDDLLRYGVHSNLRDEKLAAGKTGQCLVMVTEDADRTMNTFLGVTADIEYAQINEAALKNAEYLYIEGYLSSSPVATQTSEKAMRLARENGIKTAFSLSDPNMVKFFRDGLDKIIGEGVDLLFCNQDEALIFAKASNLQAAVDYISQLADTCVITLGAKGALIVHRGKQIEIKPHKVVAIDTNGAGDLFAGSFLHAICAGKSYAQAGDLASFAAAQLVTEYAPRLSEENLAKVKGYQSNL